MTDPYAVLGVARNAPVEDVRKAYKKLAKQFHPDLNKDPGAEDRFKEINAAWDVVGDEEKRKAFDEFGEASLRSGFDPQQARAWKDAQSRGFRGFPGGGRSAQGSSDVGFDVEDLLGSMFGTGFAGVDRGPRRGADQEAELELDFLTAVNGGERELRLRRGDGAIQTLKVRIPAGAKDGGKLRLKGQGLPPRGGGPAGDLSIHLKVAEHPLLRRVGEHDLELDVPITVSEAMAGGSITVPTPSGEVKVTVPAGAPSGTRLRLKGRGVPRRPPGDLYLVLRPTVPASTDPAVLEAARALDAAYAGDVRAALKL